jgi:hypothetical protein
MTNSVRGAARYLLRSAPYSASLLKWIDPIRIGTIRMSRLSSAYKRAGVDRSSDAPFKDLSDVR